ncbi:inversin-like isoform X22 [Dermacentor albipictus]|uniref:inversin-like isoform X22 n=1 Tax=Dermacentor albipictus TaxID=60249 RepID=UPI0031FCE212
MGTRGNDQSVLHLCALRGDWSDIQPGLLESGALEVQDRLGRTPLFLCVMLGDSQGAQLLLRAGARSDHGDHAGQTPLHLAARKGHRSLVRLLLAAGAPWARGDVHGCTPLHCVAAAAASWPAQLARSILGMVLDCMDVSQVDLQDKLKQTALHKSALACHLENMLALLKKGANALMQDVDGRTALHLCAASSQLAALGCTSLLLDAEPPLISWQDYQGCTPLHLAVASGTLAVIDLLTQRSSGEVNALDDLFRTPLHWAAILGRLEVCELLLERSADGSLTDRAGATPLHYACSSSSERAGLLVALLLSHNHGAENMDVALQSAGLSGNMAALRALSCYEMHPEAVDVQHCTMPLAGARPIARGSCFNRTPTQTSLMHRRTALDEASIRHEELCRWLRARGAVGAHEVRRAAAVAIQDLLVWTSDQTKEPRHSSFSQHGEAPCHLVHWSAVPGSSGLPGSKARSSSLLPVPQDYFGRRLFRLRCSKVLGRRLFFAVPGSSVFLSTKVHPYRCHQLLLLEAILPLPPVVGYAVAGDRSDGGHRRTSLGPGSLPLAAAAHRHVANSPMVS